MTVSAEQITTERFQLDRFLEIFPDTPIGQIKKTTHPDFVISTGERVIGVELTQLFKADRNSSFQPRQIEAFRERIVQQARKIYISDSNIPLEVGVLFSGKVLKDVQGTAMGLVNAIKNIASGSGASRIVRADEMDMPPEFSIIKFDKVASHAHCSWNIIQFGWTQDLDKCAIQTAISKKNRRITEYQNGADEIWLLLVMDQIYLSSSFKVPTPIITHTYKSAFSKTLLFSCIDKRYWCLKTTAPK